MIEPAVDVLVTDLREPGEQARLRALFEEIEPRVHAFVEEGTRWERVAAEAARCSTGPLAGVPLAVKDVYHVDGLPTFAGSEVPVEVLVGPEAAVVSTLRRAGVVVVGKARTTELAYFAPGPTRNPHDLDHTPGGSSSGSAAAVATGQCVLALGTQTIGSVGRPAAFCGVVGYKPSRDRIPRDGLIPLAPSFDHVGVFAPSVEWIGRAAAVLCEGWRDVGAGAFGPKTLAVPVGPYLERTSTEGREHFHHVCGLLEAGGFRLVEVEVMSDFEEIAARHRRVVAAEAARTHESWWRLHGHHCRAATVELIERGRAIGDDALAADLAACATLRDELERAREEAGASVWICPPAVGPAPPGLDSTGDPIMNLPWTQSGLPAIVVPAGFHGHLPMGLQIVGGWWHDERLLVRAAALVAVIEGGVGGEG